MSTTFKKFNDTALKSLKSVLAVLFIWISASSPATADEFPLVANNLPVAVEKIESTGSGDQEIIRGLTFEQTYVIKDGIWARDDDFNFGPIWEQAKTGKFAKCDIGENSLDPGILHKSNLEIFIAPMLKPSSQALSLRILPNSGELSEKILLTQRDGCLILKDDALQPVTHGLPAQHLQLELSHGDEKLLDFKVPEQHLAYLVIRYQASGAMMPVPFFIDTVLLSTDDDGVYSKVHLIFRAQFPVATKVRKVDASSFYPEQFDLQEFSASVVQNNMNRLSAAKRYFTLCPYHETQMYSKCALPNMELVSNEDYFTMLGLARR